MHRELRRNALKLTKGLTITAATILIIAAAAAATFNEPSRHADAAPSPATIDAQQLCQRTEHVRIAILQAIPGADATCTDAGPDADPLVPANYETNVTAQQLAGVTELDLMARYPEIPLIREFKDGDFQGLTGLTAIYLVVQPQITKDGLAAAGIPISVLARLETLIFVNSDISAIESADYFRGMSNLRTLSVTTNNMTYELPGNPNRPEGTKVGRLINPEAWKHLPNLRKLAIGSNRILTLPPEFFKHLSKLEELDMYDMWYEYHPYGFGSQALPADVFKGLTKLRKLDIGYNALGATEIDDGLFNGLTSLEVLNLRDNPLLETLPRSILDLPEGVTILTDPGVKYPSDGENQPATGSPTVSGEARVGETLTASVDAVQDGDGTDNAQFAYQWVRNGGTNDADIGGATGETYELSNDDVGQTVKVRVSFTDDAGNEESLTSAATAAVAAKPNPLTGSTVVDVSDQTVLGTLADGGTLTLDDPANGSYGIQVNTEPGVEIGSVRLQLTGGKSVDQTEGIAPYSLYGDDGSALNGQSLPTGSYTLRATAYSEADLGGDVLGTLEVSFTVAATNTPATGAPTISGTVQAGETLTADTSGIADEDGLDNAVFSYQWIANDGNTDADIEDETGSTYELPDDDVGKTVKVRVSFTDDGGNQETLTSVATGAVAAKPNSPATGAPAISGTAQAGETLMAATAGIADADGLDNAVFSYQWIAGGSDIDGATGSSYELMSTEQGQTIQVRVTFTDDGGSEESLTSEATEAVAAKPNTPATGAPTIGGTAQAGETLTAGVSGIADADGLDNATFSYQWVANDGNADAEIEDETGSTYELSENDVGKTINVKVSFTDDSGNSESLTSIATADVEAPLTAEIRNVPESHNGQNGFTFRILFSEPVTVDYQALKEDSFEISNGTITRARRVNGRNDLRQFTVRPSSNLDVVIVLPADRPCDDEGAICTSDGKRLSNRLELTVPGPVPANAPATGAPTISGTAQVGQTLTATTSNIADSDGLVNAVYGYQWVRNDGGTDAEIQGSTGSTYTLDAAAEGKTVKVRVSFTDDAGNEETLTSAGTAAVEARPNSPASGVPTISGTAQVGETLTASTSGIADADGLRNVAYGYQWLAADAEIAGATSSSYTLAEADKGKTIRVKVSFTDDAENQESLTSAPTETVGVSESHDRPHNLQATVAEGAITLTWQDPDTHPSRGLYHILRHRPELGEDKSLVYVEYAPSTDRTFTDSAVEPGALYVYAVKAVKDYFGFLGPASDPVEVRMPPGEGGEARPNSPATGQPTITGTAQVGETLTADTSGIADQDGLDDASFAYQWMADDSDIAGATDSTYTLTPDDLGKSVKVRVTFTDDRSNQETLTSAATSAVAAAATPLTASLENTPQTHDGQTAFTFELRFSEHIADLSYITLRDDTFMVTGGQMTKARRMDPHSNTRNIHWEITVTPSGNGDVTIVLPVTTDCGVQGAICTEDGRMLSNSLNFTVSGPGG